MRTFFVVVALVAVLALPLMAQDRVEVFGGYQYLRLNDVGGCGSSNGCPNINANGWDAAATAYFNRFFGVTGDFSGTYNTQSVSVEGITASIPLHFYTFAGGPVVAFREGKVNPFVHALFGGVHVSASASAEGASASVSQTGYMTTVGGGVDVKVNRLIAVRLVDVDWVYYHFSGIFGGPSYGSSGNVRLATGIVLKF